jgi:site-specific DNA recombinase
MLHRETYAGIWHYGKRNGTNPDDYLIPVEVPAIVSREVWEAAQSRLGKNKASSLRNTKYNYLLRRRIVCGDCGAKMGAEMTRNGRGGGANFYYYCPARRQPDFLNKCPRPCSFRAKDVDAAVWNWIKSLLSDSQMLDRALEGEQTRREEAVRPLREQLAVTDDLLADNRRQLERALDLYLSGDFDRDMLGERQARLTNAIAALEQQRDRLAAQLATRALTDTQVQSIKDFADVVARGLEGADRDFKARRQIIELLEVWVTLSLEEDEKVAYVQCMVAEDVLSIASPSS